MGYYPAFICENGDVIDASSPNCSDKHCEICGAPVISCCPHCGTVIRGHEYGTSGYFLAPSYCRNCGEPYPWTAKAIQSAIALLEEDDCISDVDRERLIDVVPDMITQTPKTQLAAVRVKKAFKSLGSFAAEGLRSFLIDFGCEILKQQIEL